MTVCNDKNCTLKENCKRYREKIQPFHTYYLTLKQNKDGTCKYFWDNKRDKHTIK